MFSNTKNPVNSFIAELMDTNNKILILSPEIFERMSLTQKKLFAKKLKRNTALEYMDVSGVKVSSSEFLVFIQILKNKKNLKALILRKNNIGAIATSFLAKALEDKDQLQHLDLGYNNIGPEAIIDLIKALKDKKQLEILGLSGNNIGTDSAILLSEGLKEKELLKGLSLSNNNIKTEAVLSLYTALKNKHHLKNLSLHSNPIKPETMLWLKRLLACQENLIRHTPSYLSYKLKINQSQTAKEVDKENCDPKEIKTYTITVPNNAFSRCSP